MVSLGVKKGVPDLCLPVRRRGYTACWVELKAAHPQKWEMSEDQRRWMDRLRQEGALAEMCRGWKEAADLLTWYLDPEARLPRRGVAV